VFWRDHYLWLQDRGYLLRARYAPGWTTTWRNHLQFVSRAPKLTNFQFEFLADATRVSDGSVVLIKKSEALNHEAPVLHEDRIFRKFSSEPLNSDPKNHCIRMVEILPVPDDSNNLIVMPFYYDWYLIPFLTIGEAVEFFSQIIEASPRVFE
ncbi:hypothetical protein FB45DRAFT_734548, partial [Roridomyces roridus]